MAEPKRTPEKPLKLEMDLDAALARFVQVDPNEMKGAAGEVRLVQPEDSAHPLLIYATEGGASVDLAVHDGTVWATQKQMAAMFGVTRENVTTHLGNIFRDGELLEGSVCKESLLPASDGKRYKTKIYDLNVVISVGYRVSSKQGTMFRIWATDKLFRILTKGFYVDTDRLKNTGAPDVLDEFREIAREIRTSIRNSYREVLRLCTLCSDYDGTSQTARAFFMEMENKLLWAAAQMTAPQLVLTRCNAKTDNLGLTYFAGKRGPTKRDVEIGNNYLAEGEARTKNRITEMWLTYVEDQLDQGRLPTIETVREKLDDFIKFNNWTLLQGRGKHSRGEATAHAHEQHRLFREWQKQIKKKRK